MENFDAFWNGFVEALYFTDTGEDDQPSPDLGLATETEENLKADCRSFMWRTLGFLRYEIDRKQTWEQAGRDFWLTRNGHGAGFWDGDWPTFGGLLSEKAKPYGAVCTFQLHQQIQA